MHLLPGGYDRAKHILRILRCALGERMPRRGQYSRAADSFQLRPAVALGRLVPSRFGAGPRSDVGVQGSSDAIRDLGVP